MTNKDLYYNTADLDPETRQAVFFAKQKVDYKRCVSIAKSLRPDQWDELVEKCDFHLSVWDCIEMVRDEGLYFDIPEETLRLHDN